MNRLTYQLDDLTASRRCMSCYMEQWCVGFDTEYNPSNRWGRWGRCLEGLMPAAEQGVYSSSSWTASTGLFSLFS
jgi:hypothetical protein